MIDGKKKFIGSIPILISDLPIEIPTEGVDVSNLLKCHRRNAFRPRFGKIQCYELDKMYDITKKLLQWSYQ